MTFAHIVSALRRRPFRRLGRETTLFGAIFFSAALCGYSGQDVPPLSLQDDTSKGTQENYADAHPYLDEPIEQLIKRIPELDNLRAAVNQQPLPALLQRTAEQVDESFRNIVDVIARESITEEKLNGSRSVMAREEVEANYLILRRGSSIWGSMEECRMDAKGEHLIEPGLRNGYFVTSNFALMRAYFGTFLQPEAMFRYLGEQSAGTREVYVVAFAQKPGASMPLTLEGDGGPHGHYRVQMLVQGIAWIDKGNAQILRMRTDLLAPRPEIGLGSLTTIVNSEEFSLPDVASPLWLPASVEVAARFTYNDGDTKGTRVEAFRNEHHYSNYQLYRVSVRMVPEAAPLSASDVARAGNADVVMTPEKAEQSYYAGVHPYLEEPLEQLAQQIPELKKIKPAADPQALTTILKKAGNNVDSYFSNVVDLTAREKITLQRSVGKMSAVSHHVEDNYLILKKPYRSGSQLVEYRTDAAGNHVDNIGMSLGFLVTRGFAMMANFFGGGWQRESSFKYLGEQKLGSRDTYVVGFAQTPGLATLTVNMNAGDNLQYPVLTQGIAWIDKSNLQIVRMRTDLLAPHPELGLERQTTDVTFSEVRLADVAMPLWLPQDVKVDVRFKKHDSENGRTQEISFRNDHHYSEYRRYRVSVKMVAP